MNILVLIIIIIASKEMNAYSDFPPPDHFANYMHNVGNLIITIAKANESCYWNVSWAGEISKVLEPPVHGNLHSLYLKDKE